MDPVSLRQVELVREFPVPDDSRYPEGPKVFICELAAWARWRSSAALSSVRVPRQPARRRPLAAAVSNRGPRNAGRLRHCCVEDASTQVGRSGGAANQNLASAATTVVGRCFPAAWEKLGHDLGQRGAWGIYSSCTGPSWRRAESSLNAYGTYLLAL